MAKSQADPAAAIAQARALLATFSIDALITDQSALLRDVLALVLTALEQQGKR